MNKVVFCLGVLLFIQNTQLYAKECWAGASAKVQRADGRMESPFWDATGTAHFYLTPGDTVLVSRDGCICYCSATPVLSIQTVNGVAEIDTVYYLPDFSYQKVTLPGEYTFSTTADIDFPISFLIEVGYPATMTCHVWLDGLFDPFTNLMTDHYWNHSSLGSSSTSFPPCYGMAPGDLQPGAIGSGANRATQWVRVECRDTIDPSIVVMAKYFVLQRDGDVIDEYGSSTLKFEMPVGSYHIVVRHSNHLGAMTSGVYDLFTTSPDVDFRDPSLPLFGTEAMRSAYGTRLLWAGNLRVETTGPQKVKYTGPMNDRDLILQNLQGQPNAVATCSNHAYPSDADRDGQVKYAGANNDRDVILRTIDPLVPTSVRVEQLPY